MEEFKLSKEGTEFTGRGKVNEKVVGSMQASVGTEGLLALKEIIWKEEVVAEERDIYN